jgi:hypothetical protein
MGTIGKPAPEDSMTAKAADSHSRQAIEKRTVEYPPDTLTEPPHKSLIRSEAQGLHPLGALARIHVRQEDGELPSFTPIKARR